MNYRFLVITLCVLSITCNHESLSESNHKELSTLNTTSLIVLGVMQDAGQPHIGCHRSCCVSSLSADHTKRRVSSLGLYDAATHKIYVFDATPDFTSQLYELQTKAQVPDTHLIDGIFLTHAHIGHYTGLMYLGKEAKGAQNVPVYAMPRMKSFLENNGPWSQLVSQENIAIQEIKNNTPIVISSELEVIPLLVPHRDEYSETVGYRIKGPNRSALFIPDIDKWEKWNLDIVQEVKKVDYAFLDATFFSGVELDNRDMSEIPHPFILESIDIFNDLPRAHKEKIHFIHLNHSNPVVKLDSKERQEVLAQGYHIAQRSELFQL